MKNKLIYLAAPYTHDDAVVRQERVNKVNEMTAKLLNQGLFILSPLTQSESLLEYGLPSDWGFWRDYDLNIITRCDELWVLRLPGWAASIGVTEEAQFAADQGIPIRYIDYEP